MRPNHDKCYIKGRRLTNLESMFLMIQDTNFKQEEFNNVVDEYIDIIIQTPCTCSGEPRVSGTRITVKNVLQQLAGGTTIQEICEDFKLKEEQVVAAIRWVIDDLDSRY